jgi:acyl carrier protein
MNVKQTLLKLASLNIKLRKLGGPEKNGLLFENMMKMEDEFGLEIPEKDAEKLKTISDVISFIQTNKK